MAYVAAEDRYDGERACTTAAAAAAASSSRPISLGLWHNFGDDDPLDETSARILRRAFDLGVTHFDLANNYGPPYGSAETNFGRILATTSPPYRDELIISTKAGCDMWPGPYGEWGSRKYLLASLDQSPGPPGPRLRRHLLLAPRRPRHPARGDDGRARTPPSAQGKALYVGISSYSPERRARRPRSLRELGTPLLIHQPSYSMLNRWIEDGLLDDARRSRASAASPSRRSPRACSPTATSTASRRTRAPRRATRSVRRLLDDDTLGRVPRAQRDRRSGAASRSPSSPSRGRCATRGHLGAHRRLAASRSSTTTSPRWTGRRSPTTSSPRSTATPSTPASTSGRSRPSERPERGHPRRRGRGRRGRDVGRPPGAAHGEAHRSRPRDHRARQGHPHLLQRLRDPLLDGRRRRLRRRPRRSHRRRAPRSRASTCGWAPRWSAPTWLAREPADGGRDRRVDQLVVATGASAVVPAGHCADGTPYDRVRHGAHARRRRCLARALRGAADGAHVVIVGAGYVGVEVAEAARRHGFGVTVGDPWARA